MVRLSDTLLADGVPCPYLPGRIFVQEYFFGYNLTETELSGFLEEGWRHFGPFFFRPACPRCRACRPLRVRVQDFVPSRSQRRVIRKNRETAVHLAAPLYRPEYYNLFDRHSRLRFDKGTEEEDFQQSFFTPAAPGFLMEYLPGGSLAGLGFVDTAAGALSSVYFAFDPAWGRLSPGTFSVLRELELARQWNLSWHYLGYWLEENSSLAYKSRFRPFELYNWDKQRWEEGS